MLFTLALRLLFLLTMRGQPYSAVSPHLVDSWYYHRWALAILHGDIWGHDVFFLRPLYPYLLALAYRVFGVHLLPVQLTQAAMAVVSCALLYDVARRIFDSHSARFAALGFALCGPLVFYTGTLLHVELTVLLSLLTVWLMLLAGRRWWAWLLAGLCFGLLVICRPELLIVLPFLAVWLWRRATSVRDLSVMLATALAVVAAVPVRNYLVARDPVLFTAHSGINFYYGNNPSADGTWQPTSELERGVGFSHERLKRTSRTVGGKVLSWSQTSVYWQRQSLRFIVTEPGRYLSLLGRKLLLFISSYEVPNDYYLETAQAASPVLRFAFAGFGLVLALAVVGMVWAWPLRRDALPVYLFVAAYLVSSLVFYVLSRLRAPVLPFLLMFAGFAVAEGLAALRERSGRRLGLGVGLAAATFAVSLAIPVRRNAYSAQAWTQAGNIHIEMKQPTRAVAAYRRALAADSTNVAARYSLLMTLAAQGKTAEAESACRRIAGHSRTGGSSRIFATLAAARVAVARHDFAAAAGLYEHAFALDSLNSETAYLLGLVCVSMDSLSAAAAWLARALELSPDHDGARDALDRVTARLRRQH
jgi:4-amino-4-deoxy-L-arabinose transferase-like glycosyltransferase